MCPLYFPIQDFFVLVELRRRHLKMVLLETDAQQDITAQKDAVHLNTALMAHTPTQQVCRFLIQAHIFTIV